MKPLLPLFLSASVLLGGCSATPQPRSALNHPAKPEPAMICEDAKGNEIPCAPPALRR